MDFIKATGSENVDSSLWPRTSNSLANILTEINQNVKKMLRLMEDDNEIVSTEKLLSLYQSLGERYNDLNQELLNGLLKFNIIPSRSDHHNDSMAHSSSFNPENSHSQELGLVSPGKKTSSEMVRSSKPHFEVEKNQSAFLLADTFYAELETALRELEARKIDIETEKREVIELESKLLDSNCKIEILERELEQTNEILQVSEAEVSKLMEMWNDWKAEKAKLETDIDSFREESRARYIQIEQMEEYLNQVISESRTDKNVADEVIISESRTDKNVADEEDLRARIEELEKEVELQRNVISEREEDKRKAIRQLCFSVDHYKSRYIELVRSLSSNKN